jgi:DNA processing protein
MRQRAVDSKTLTLALALTQGLGGKTLARIHARNELLGRTPAEFITMSREVLVEGYALRGDLADRWIMNHAARIDAAQRMRDAFAKFDIDFATPVDAHYPESLETFDSEGPGLIFFHGNAKLLSRRTFAVMSSRKSPAGPLAQLERCVEAGVLNGEVLVAGHNTPEYQRAAVVPLRWGAPRILVLDRGFFKALGKELSDEPFRAARLWRYEFDASTDLVVSICHPFVNAYRNANRDRDHLVAALSMRLDFTWVSEGGTMEKLLQKAAKAGRAVQVSDLILQYRSYVQEGATVLELPS